MRLKALLPLALWPTLTSPKFHDPSLAIEELTKTASRVLNLSPEGSIRYSSKAINNLIYIYDKAKKEIPFCQQSVNYKGEIIVYDIRIPSNLTYIHADTVGYTKCADLKDYQGMVHNHYNNFCEFSGKDSSRFRKDSKAKIATIVCFASIEKDSVVFRTMKK